MVKSVVPDAPHKKNDEQTRVCVCVYAMFGGLGFRIRVVGWAEDHHVPWAKDEAQGCGHARELVAIRGDTVQPEEHVWSLKGYFMGSPSSPNTPTPSAMRRSRTPEPLSGRSLETFAGRVMSEGMSAALHVHTPTEMMRNLTSRFEG